MNVKRNIIANYLGQAWTAAMGLAFVPLYIKFMGMEAYGLIGFFALLQTWLSLLDFGLVPTLTREMAKPAGTPEGAQHLRDLLRSVEGVVCLIALGTAAVLWGGSQWVASTWVRANTLSPASVANSIALMGLVVALRFLENVYRGSLVGLQRQVELNVATSVLATLRGAGAVAVLAWVSNDVQAFFVWQVIASLATVATFAALAYKDMPAASAPGRFSPDALRNVRRFSTGSFAISLLGFLLSQLDKVLLSKMLSLSDFGHYSLAAVLAAYVRLLANSIDQATYPRFVALWNADQLPELARQYHKATQLTVVLMGGAGIGLAVFGKAFLIAWTQNHALAEAVYPLLCLLMIGMVGNGLMNNPYYLQMAAGRTSLLFKTNLAMVAVFAPVLVLATMRFGGLGAAAAWAGINVAYLAIVPPLMHKQLLPGEMRSWYADDLAKPLAAALAAALAMRVLVPGSPGVAAAAAFAIIGCISTVLAAALAAGSVRHSMLSKFGKAVRHA